MVAVTSSMGPFGLSGCCGAPVEQHTTLVLGQTYTRCVRCKSRVV